MKPFSYNNKTEILQTIFLNGERTILCKINLSRYSIYTHDSGCSINHNNNLYIIINTIISEICILRVECPPSGWAKDNILPFRTIEDAEKCPLFFVNTNKYCLRYR